METTEMDTTTETTQQQQETIPVASPLAVRQHQLAEVAVWTDQRRKLVKDQVCPAGISDGEFEVFMLQCLRSGLDPLLKQAFCVSRNMKVKKKRRGPTGGEITYDEYVEVHTFQAAVAGMLARAEQFPGYQGTSAAVFYEGEKVYPDYEKGTVKHEVLNAADTKPRKIVGAYAIVRREGRTPVISVRYLSECKGDSPMWKAWERAMMLKCPQAEALRLAFPDAFAGLYDAAEEHDGGVLPAVAQRSAFRPPPGVDSPPDVEEAVAAAPQEGIEDGVIVPAEGELLEPGADALSPADAEREAAEFMEAEKARVMERLQGCTDLAALRKVAEEELHPLDQNHPVRVYLKPLYNELYDKFGGQRPTQPTRRGGR
jgi:phage recombination protein Bet